MKKDFDFTSSAGQLLYFPDGLKFALSVLSPPEILGPTAMGLLVKSLNLRDVYNPLDVLPQESIIWSSVRCTAGGRRHLLSGAEDLGFSSRTRSRMTVVMNSINSLLTFRLNENMNRRYQNSSSYDVHARLRRRRTENEQKRACELIIETGLHPCQIFFEDGAQWVWVYPEDVMMP